MRLGIVDTGSMEVHRDEFGSPLIPDVVTSWTGLHELGGFDDAVLSGAVRRRIIAGAPRFIDDIDDIDDAAGGAW